MKSGFPFRITEEHLFCRRCCKLQRHGIFAKEAYSIRGGLSPKITLLCICDHCRTSHVAFSQEFSFACQDFKNQDYAKIPGKNRLTIGNWIYIKGEARPGKIKGCFSSQDNNNLLSIDYGNGRIEEISVKEPDSTQKEDAVKGYRLLPSQSGETLIGDYVYHVKRDMFGKAIGLVHDNDKDKLAIQLENGTILFLTLPPEFQSLPNRRLEETAKFKLKDLPEEIKGNLNLKALSGVLYLNGKVESLAERRKVLQCLNSIVCMRGIYDELLVCPKNPKSDSELEDQIHRIFEDSKEQEFAYYEIQVNHAAAKIKIGYYSKQAVDFFEHKIENLPGIVELSISPECVQPPSPQEMERLQAMENTQRIEGDSQNRIFIRLANDCIYISGRVKNLFQKKLIQFSVINQNSIRIIPLKNNLRITPN